MDKIKTIILILHWWCYTKEHSLNKMEK